MGTNHPKYEESFNEVVARRTEADPTAMPDEVLVN